MPQHAAGDDRAAEDADEVGVQAEQRHHQAQGDGARQDQELHRVDAHGGERVDLLGHLHGAELRGERGAGAAGHDDAGHQRAHLVHDGDADQVGDVDLGAELLELDRADEGHDDADQEADQRDDRQRVGAGLLHEQQQVAAAEAGAAAQRVAGGDGQLRR